MLDKYLFLFHISTGRDSKVGLIIFFTTKFKSDIILEAVKGRMDIPIPASVSSKFLLFLSNKVTPNSSSKSFNY